MTRRGRDFVRLGEGGGGGGGSPPICWLLIPVAFRLAGFGFVAKSLFFCVRWATGRLYLQGYGSRSLKHGSTGKRERVPLALRVRRRTGAAWKPPSTLRSLLFPSLGIAELRLIPLSCLISEFHVS